MRDTYLTVDLDYWCGTKLTGNGLDFVKKLFELDRPTKVFTEHHLILKDITSQYNKVCNVDFHSDIGDKAMWWPNCGTWANYVFGRQNAEFEWRYPDHKKCIKNGMGLCHPEHEDGSEDDPFTHKELCSWKQLSRRQGLSDIEFDKVDKISIILSPAWVNYSVIHDTLLFLNSLNNKDKLFNNKSVQRTLNKMLRMNLEYKLKCRNKQLHMNASSIIETNGSKKQTFRLESTDYNL